MQRWADEYGNICVRAVSRPTLASEHFLLCDSSLQEQVVKATKQREERRKNPKPEQQEGMPQREQ
jgi:hypothetical protein